MDFCVLTCITLLLRPVMSASFCSVWASGLLSWANWACMICTWRRIFSIKPIRSLQRSLRIGLRIEAKSAARLQNGLQIVLKNTLVIGWDWCDVLCLTCSCSAVKDVRALLAGLGWLSCSVGTAPSNVIPLPEKHNGRHVRWQTNLNEMTKIVPGDLNQTTWKGLFFPQSEPKFECLVTWPLRNQKEAAQTY